MLRQATKLTAARRGLLSSSSLRLDKHNLTHSNVGPFTNYTLRQRYPIYLNSMTDTTITDFFWGKFATKWFEDGPSANYWWGSVLAGAAASLYLLRQVLFNPSIFFRKQEIRLPHPDRFRQNCYALPFFNHRLRNWSQKHVWICCPNEMDWKDSSLSGVRPTRMQAHRLPHFWSIWHWSMAYLYPMEDPLYTTNCYENRCRIHHNEKYRIDPLWNVEEE